MKKLRVHWDAVDRSSTLDLDVGTHIEINNTTGLVTFKEDPDCGPLLLAIPADRLYSIMRVEVPE